jgi:hypothetical protein
LHGTVLVTWSHLRRGRLKGRRMLDGVLLGSAMVYHLSSFDAR